MSGLRKCFHKGLLASVAKAVFLNTVLIGEAQTEQGGQVCVSLLVSANAAGSVIGKGGENMKAIREQTGCKVNMDKQSEMVEGLGGRTLTLQHPSSAATVAQAIYSVMRLVGFSSLSYHEDRNLANTGYGPASGMGGGNSRYSPYGGQAGGADVCALHGKKRGQQNLQPSPTVHGQFVCFDHDQCKGAVVGMDTMGMAGLGGMAGYGADMSAMMGQMGQMGQMGMGGMGNMYAPQMDLASTCSLHQKRRGARNLQPHPTQLGLYMCLESDPCKINQNAGGGGMAGGRGGGMMGGDTANTCATHGKRRGARNLQPHPSTAGVFICLNEDPCKV